MLFTHCSISTKLCIQLQLYLYHPAPSVARSRTFRLMASYLPDWLMVELSPAATVKAVQLEVFSHPGDDADAQQKAFIQMDH